MWAAAFVSDDVLARTISELRRAFDDNPREPRFIQTIPKRGYRLVASVGPAARNLHEPIPAVQRPTKQKWFSATAALVALLIFCGVIFRGNSSANWPAKLATASSFPAQVEAHTQDVPVDVSKDRAADPVPGVAKKTTSKVLHSDAAVSKQQPLTVITVLNNTNISQNVDAVAGQATAEKVPPRTEALYQNIQPDVVRTRVKHAVLPVYPASAIQAHVGGTVEVGLAVSPTGEVYSARILMGHPLLATSALEAMRQWRFEPNQVQGVFTWSRMRALVRFLPDGTTAVAFGPPILADSFGDLGSQRDELRDAAILPVIPSAQ